MALAQILDYLFDTPAQQRGRGLFSTGAVRVLDASRRHMHARVLGGGEYDVHLKLDDEELLVGCECPFYEDRGPCKHLWATILAADQRGALTDASAARNLRVVDDLDAFLADGLDFDFTGLPRKAPLPPPPPRNPPWHDHLAAVERELSRKLPTTARKTRPSEILYVIDVPGSKSTGRLTIELLSRTRKKNGDWTAAKPFGVSAEDAGRLPDAVDREAITAMLGGSESYSYGYYAGSATRKSLPYLLAVKLLPLMASSDRLRFRDGYSGDLKPAAWDAGEPWRLWLEVRQDDRDQWNITGSLRRGDQRMDLDAPQLLLESGLLLADGKVAAFDSGGAFAWAAQLRNVRRIPFPDRERDLVMQRLMDAPALPSMDVDAPLAFQEIHAQPRLGLRVKQVKSSWGEVAHTGQLLFDYGRGWIDGTQEGRGIWIPEERVFVARNAEAESAGRETLLSLGMRQEIGDSGRWSFTRKSLPRAVRELIQAGWHVEAEGKAFRKPGATRVDVRSGIDWFELHGEVDYDGATVSLPRLLAAARRGESVVVLGDGSFGLLPEEWLARFAPLAGLGTKEEDHLRFRQNQAGLLDALLAAQPEVRVDEIFAHVRERMRRFDGIQAAVQPEGFSGELRHYQREGLGWMEFLREFGFGGCLADDMGVGKTAQVLAALESRRGQGHGPSLVVVPKSVMFNWRQEAARFTPHLRVLEHFGIARDEALIKTHDLVLTTYGTMLRDIPVLSQIEFDYVVLDEAQAVKNASTSSAKAVRLLRGKHRLALSGTPVENHLGELWSLFEFLNPGMLGEAKVLNVAGGLARNPGDEARELLRHALRPFILRRTKQQVTPELPAKTEQTIYCELDGPELKQYEELRKHFRSSLLQRVERDGLGRSKMHVLEALLRLRQAACHPGLLDAKRVDDRSAKLDTLLAQLAELREEGHKALVFSQFTSLLAIVRRRLDEMGVRYEYLDGATRDRQSHVEKFQNDPDCGFFLISLKAGGLGLNLTAAEYVFLLDPWWNPAVEAQAMDRAHRIGQTKPVFAYRLIAKGTVEEKVLELQKTKRDLADAILSEDNSLIRNLKREDLELLLS
jgi:superfamily II DNA or RNA helicase